MGLEVVAVEGIRSQTSQPGPYSQDREEVVVQVAKMPTQQVLDSKGLEMVGIGVAGQFR